MNSDPIIFVALSGGVDSAVVAKLSGEKYKNLIGISHTVWTESKCCTTECIDQCRKYCVIDLGIPYFNIDCRDEFEKQVVDEFVRAYVNGVTPNPCVLCNEYIRFDYMVRQYFKQKHIKNIPDYKIATGHYARVEQKDDKWFLRKGKDLLKDQSYMLYRLSQEQLSHCLFLLGDYLKSEVRDLAEKWDLSSAKKADSQDACFVSGKYQDFLLEYTQIVFRTGNFLDINGNVIGEHKGIIHYTRGQRKGLGLSGGPWYVLSIDPDNNIVVLGQENDLFVSEFAVKDLYWIYQDVEVPFKCAVQTRYHAQEIDCTLEMKDNDTVVVKLNQASRDVSPGQSAVFYDGEYVVGGGIVI